MFRLLPMANMCELDDFGQSEEERMLQKQEQISEEQDDQYVIDSSSAMFRVPTINGEGDGTGYSSGLLQVTC